MGKPARPGSRTRTAQHRPLQCSDCARVRAFGRAKPNERMLEQRKHCDRRDPRQRRFRGQARKSTGRRVGERITAGIVRRNIPAL